MALTVDAIFEGGAFKPPKDAALSFSEGARVTLTIEDSPKEPAPRPREEFLKFSDNPEASRILSQAAEQFRRMNEERRLSQLSPELADLLRRDEQVEQTRSQKILDGVNETFEFWTQGPKDVRDMIKQQFRSIVTEVRDIRPVEAKNKVQTKVKTALAYFSNVSSLFIYVILIAAGLKVIFLFVGQSTRLVQTFESMKYFMTPLMLLLILICLLTMRGLHRVSRFVKSYRVMSILGCFIAVKVLIKTAIVLFTATSFRAMGSAAAQLFMGALK